MDECDGVSGAGILLTRIEKVDAMVVMLEVSGNIWFSNTGGL